MSTLQKIQKAVGSNNVSDSIMKQLANAIDEFKDNVDVWVWQKVFEELSKD